MRIGIGIGVPPFPAQRGGFAPSQLTGGELWLRADDPGIVVTGLGVSTWPDAFGTGHNATQTTDADRPALNASGWTNGLPTVDFDSANTEFMNLASFAETGNDYTVHAVIDPITSPANATVLSSVGTGGSQAVFYQNSVGSVAFYDGSSRNDGASNTNPQSITWVIDGTANTVAFYRNGVFQSTVAITGDSRLNGDTRLGMYFGGAQEIDARLAEVIVYSRVLSAAELASLHAYSNVRYGL